MIRARQRLHGRDIDTGRRGTEGRETSETHGNDVRVFDSLRGGMKSYEDGDVRGRLVTVYGEVVHNNEQAQVAVLAPSSSGVGPDRLVN
jgi:hypothetical protein